MAAAGDERYLLCAAGAAGVVSVPPLCSATSGCSCARSSLRPLNLWFRSHWNGCMIVVMLCCHVRIVDLCKFATGCCETHCNGCMNVAWALFWGGSRSTKPCIFPCTVAAGGDERYLLCAAGAAGVVSVPPLCSATSGCFLRA